MTPSNYDKGTNLFLLWSITFISTFIPKVIGEFSESGPKYGYVNLDNRGYTGILVAVDSTVSYDSRLYDNIYNYLSQTSKALHAATSKESPLYFKEATVLFPQNWPNMPQCESVTSEIQNEATFLIGPDTEQWGSNPHTIRLNSQCGKPGLVTILPESFVKDENIAKRYGADIGKTILHEWAHLRYGVFDESNEDTGGNSCVWFEGGAMYPVKCSTDIKGQLRSSQNGNGCEFIPDNIQPKSVKASLMYKPYLSSITQFCDKEGGGIHHNDQVPNPQNDRCYGKSIWEVLRAHPDFQRKGIFRRKRQVPEGLTLRCVQARHMARMVLTMDVSSSMKTRGRLLRMQQDVELFLKNIPCRDTAVGLVEFSATNTERILHHLVSISSDVNLRSVISSIPERVINRTCIGCGIRAALKAIKQSGMATQGAVIVVFTDGLENDKPSIAEVTQEVLKSGAVIYGILLLSTAEDHELIQLARKTGGTSCVYTDKRHQTSYYDCLEGILHHRSPHAAPIQILNSVVETPPNQHSIGTIYIDLHLTKNSLVSVTWDNSYSVGCSKLEVSMMSPKDDVIGPQDVARYVKDENSRSISIDVSGFPAGKWTYRLDNKHPYNDCSVRLLIEGRQKLVNCSRVNTDDDPVMMIPQVDKPKLQLDAGKSSEDNAIKLYTRLVQGSSPVINAIVHAEIIGSSGKKWTIQLWDNGAGADFMAQDGIYSRYFIGYNNFDTKYRRDDTYSIKFDVQWQSVTRLQMSTYSFGTGAPVMDGFKAKPKNSLINVEPFQRSSAGQYFSIYHNVEENPITYAPAKIADLKATLVDRMEMKLRLTWTALGNELDQGQAMKYKIGISSSASQLRKSFNSSKLITENFLLSGSLLPKPAGERESITIQLLDHPDITNDTIYFIAVKTMNSQGILGPVSNVQLFIFVFSSVNIQPVVGNKSPVSSFPIHVWYIIGIAAALTLLILLVIFIVVKRRRRNNHKKEDEADTESNIYDDVEVAKPQQTVVEPNEYVVGVSKRDTSSGENAPDLLNEIRSTKANLKKQQKFKKKDNGLYTISSRISARGSTNKNTDKEYKKHRKSILKSLRKTGSGMFKKQKPNQAKGTRKPIHKPWMSPDEPLQNHSYTNPLFGESAIVPELVVRNSIIVEK